jgi:pilus assembly protein CpaF
MSDQRQVFKDVIAQNLAPIKGLLDDPSVSEILVNSHDEIFVERKGKMERVSAAFADEDTLRAAIVSIAQSVGRTIDDENPRLDARLPDGSRIAAVLKPPARNGNVLSIRKFTANKISWQDYIRFGAISEDGSLFMQCCMILGKNILVSGGTGSGKTTLLNLLCSSIPPGQRVLVIEDSSELQIDYEHVVMFETRQADREGKGEVTIKDLLKSALRLRPDRIIVGEVRASEAIELINAMNTGHKGCMGTVHANSPEDAIVRMEALAQSGDAQLSERALRSQVSSAIDVIIQISRFSDGSRRIAAISEVLGFSPDGTYKVVPIFQMSRMVKGKDGKLIGRLEPTGHVPSFMHEIADNNLPLPRSKFAKPSGQAA